MVPTVSALRPSLQLYAVNGQSTAGVGHGCSSTSDAHGSFEPIENIELWSVVARLKKSRFHRSMHGIIQQETRGLGPVLGGGLAAPFHLTTKPTAPGGATRRSRVMAPSSMPHTTGDTTTHPPKHAASLRNHLSQGSLCKPAKMLPIRPKPLFNCPNWQETTLKTQTSCCMRRFRPLRLCGAVTSFPGFYPRLQSACLHCLQWLQQCGAKPNRNAPKVCVTPSFRRTHA